MGAESDWLTDEQALVELAAIRVAWRDRKVTAITSEEMVRSSLEALAALSELKKRIPGGASQGVMVTVKALSDDLKESFDWHPLDKASAQVMLAEVREEFASRMEHATTHEARVRFVVEAHAKLNDIKDRSGTTDDDTLATAIREFAVELRDAIGVEEDHDVTT